MKKYQPYIPIEECVSLPSNWNEIGELAMQGHSFDFLFGQEEDIYSINKKMI